MQSEQRYANPYHPDILIFLILIPFIAGINYYLTYTNIRFNGFLVLTFTIDTIQGYLAIAGVRYFIFFLDRKLPIEQQPVKRILIQLFSTGIIGLLIISLTTELVSWIARNRPAPSDFYTTDLVIIGIWFFVVNGIYIGLYLFNKWRNSESALHREVRLKNEGLMVRQGKQDIRLSFDEIAGFSVDNEYVAVCAVSGKKYYYDQSLDKLEGNLPRSLFFRLNRQYIVHQNFISGYKRVENGKLLVSLKDIENFPKDITVSRLKAPAFKRWFRTA
ncbi:MAG: LytTR family transcriptional regulator DNA-binding domain-containing protein [Cyclobacteriaceae bacterium]|nr:LytTR family transcriptional regulator DNA-binding domain-containing protein [Cyclobacteriaceae bacterium]